MLAASGGFVQLDSDQQRALLRGLTATNVYGFSTYHSVGQPLARNDDRPFQPPPAQMPVDLAQSGAAVHGLATVPGTRGSALIFAAPYASSRGALAGYVAAELDVDALSQSLGSIASVGRAGTSAFVLDSDGNVVLHPRPSSADAAARPPRVEIANSGQATGALRYRLNAVEYAAAHSVIAPLGWDVVSAFPVSYALAGVQTGREWAFGLLVLVAGLSTGFALFVADKVVAPLNVLGNADGTLERSRRPHRSRGPALPRCSA